MNVYLIEGATVTVQDIAARHSHLTKDAIRFRLATGCRTWAGFAEPLRDRRSRRKTFKHRGTVQTAPACPLNLEFNNWAGPVDKSALRWSL